jgi:hemerythrin-like metal-binding protein
MFGGIMEVKWSEKFVTGNEIIDVQHRKLLQIVNVLRKNMLDGKGTRVLENTIEEMSMYAWLHFRTEEDLLLKSGYTKLREHKAGHDAFKTQLLKFASQTKDHIENLHVEAVHLYLHRWITEHIIEEDMDAIHSTE